MYGTEKDKGVINLVLKTLVDNVFLVVLARFMEILT